MARGSVFKRSGAWAFRVDAGFHPETGRRRQVLRQGFATNKQAEAALTDVLQAASRNSVVAKSSTRLADFPEDWLASQKTCLGAATWHSDGHAIKRVDHHLGQVALQSLTTLQPIPDIHNPRYRVTREG